MAKKPKKLKRRTDYVSAVTGLSVKTFKVFEQIFNSSPSTPKTDFRYKPTEKEQMIASRLYRGGLIKRNNAGLYRVDRVKVDQDVFWAGCEAAAERAELEISEKIKKERQGK